MPAAPGFPVRWRAISLLAFHRNSQGDTSNISVQGNKRVPKRRSRRRAPPPQDPAQRAKLPGEIAKAQRHADLSMSSSALVIFDAFSVTKLRVRRISSMTASRAASLCSDSKMFLNIIWSAPSDRKPASRMSTATPKALSPRRNLAGSISKAPFQFRIAHSHASYWVLQQMAAIDAVLIFKFADAPA
jgi:hypothetical protein